MSESPLLPIGYLLILVVLLGSASWFVVRQVLKTRRAESQFSQLQTKVREKTASSADYYALASLQLDKKLYRQAIANLQQALKRGEAEPDEAKALIYNALGFAYAAQEQYDLAIRQYKDALKCLPAYPIALNNLGFAYEKKQLIKQALEVYDEVLQSDPENKTAKARHKSLSKRV
jgi:tetratricopeptide (TPR) repeat protein